MSFTVGDQVEWTSQANGGTSTKRGTVICVIPAGAYAADTLQKFILCNSSNAANLDGAHSRRNHESYFIRVDAPSSSHAKPRLYWPRVVLLRKVTEGAFNGC